MFTAGIGTILVGLFPENTISLLHVIGAGMPLLVGNIGLVILGIDLPMPKTLKLYTIFSGIVSVLALILFVTHSYVGIGPGGTERIAAYPQTIWLIIFGFYIFKDYRAQLND